MFSSFLNLVSPVRLGVFCALVPSLLGVGGWSGYRLARNYYAPLLMDAQQQVGRLTTANTQLNFSIAQQNKAVDALEAQAQKRAQDATQAVQAARSQAEKSQRRAQSLLLSKPPTGQNACAAAQQAFDDALRAERVAP